MDSEQSIQPAITRGDRPHFDSTREEILFLDATQAINIVWHLRLLFKLKAILTSTYYLTLQSSISDKFFSVCKRSQLSSILPLLAGVPQELVLPLLYIIYIHDILNSSETMMSDLRRRYTLLNKIWKFYICPINFT